MIWLLWAGCASPAGPEVAVGGVFSCSLEHKAVTCWSDDAGAPVPIPPARSLSVGRRHACALTDAGEVWCWGDAAFGAGGDAKGAPREIALPAPATAVSAGWDESCALSDGGTWCWGTPWHRMAIGVGATDTPRRLPGADGARAVQAGGARRAIVDAGGDLRTTLRQDANATLRSLTADFSAPVLQGVAEVRGFEDVLVARTTDGALLASSYDGTDFPPSAWSQVTDHADAFAVGSWILWIGRGEAWGAPVQPSAAREVPAVQAWTATRIPALDGSTSLAIATGGATGGCAVGADRSVRCWKTLERTETGVDPVGLRGPPVAVPP